MADDTGRRPATRPPVGRAPTQRDTPFGAGVSLGRWFGVQVRAHWSVLIILGLFTVVIATADLPATRPGESSLAYWVAGAVMTVVLFVTLLAHELAHAITARHYGLPVRRITLWMLGGLTELGGESPTPRADALIAAAGPLTSLALGGVFAAAAWLVGGSLVGTALAWLAALNVVLAVFNLLPGAPLDGGRLLRAFLWWRTHDRAQGAEGATRAGRVLGMVFVGLGLVELLLGNVGGAWLALIGWFVINGSTSERYAVRAERLHGLTVLDAMTPTPQAVPDWWTVQQFVDGLSPEASRQAIFPLVDLDGMFTGAITLKALDRVSSDRWSSTHMHDLAAQTGHLMQADPADDLSHVVLPLHLRGGVAVVVDHGRPIGVVTEDDVNRVAQLARSGWPGARRPGT